MMIFRVWLLLCLPAAIFGNNEVDSIEKDFAKAVETTNTKETLDEFFKKHPDLLIRSNLFKGYILDLANARKIQIKSKEIASYFEPVGAFIRKHIPAVGGPIASGIELVGKIIENGGLIVGKLEEMSSRHDIDALKIISTDEMILRSLVDTYYNQILPAAKKLETLTSGRVNLITNEGRSDNSILEQVKTVLSPGAITNTIADLTDSIYLTDHMAERANEVLRVQRRLKLGKLRFEYHVRTLQIKAIEREIVERQKHQSWLAQYEKQPSLINDLREEIEQKLKIAEHESQKASITEDPEIKRQLLESIDEVKRQIRVNEDHFQSVADQYTYTTMLRNRGITIQQLSTDIEELKSAVTPLITLNGLVQNDIVLIDRSYQVDELAERVKVLEGKIANK